MVLLHFHLSRYHLHALPQTPECPPAGSDILMSLLPDNRNPSASVIFCECGCPPAWPVHPASRCSAVGPDHRFAARIPPDPGRRFVVLFSRIVTPILLFRISCHYIMKHSFMIDIRRSPRVSKLPLALLRSLYRKKSHCSTDDYSQ